MAELSLPFSKAMAALLVDLLSLLPRFFDRADQQRCANPHS